MNILLSKMKEPAVHFATISTAVTHQSAADYLDYTSLEIESVAKLNHQPSSSLVQSPHLAADLSSGLGNF